MKVRYLFYCYVQLGEEIWVGILDSGGCFGGSPYGGNFIIQPYCDFIAATVDVRLAFYWETAGVVKLAVTEVEVHSGEPVLFCASWDIFRTADDFISVFKVLYDHIS